MKKLLSLIFLLVIAFLLYQFFQKNPLLVKNDIPTNTVTQNEAKYTYILFFNNSIKNPNLIDCTKLFPIERQTTQLITPEFVMEELMKGLTKEELKAGYVTAIPNECDLNFITIEDEKAIVDFKPFQIACSCATGMFTSQVKQTMLALGTIKEVVISIQGNSGDEILQP